MEFGVWCPGTHLNLSRNESLNLQPFCFLWARKVGLAFEIALRLICKCWDLLLISGGPDWHDAQDLHSQHNFMLFTKFIIWKEGGSIYVY